MKVHVALGSNPRYCVPNVKHNYELDDGDRVWIECEECLNWYHTDCVGILDDDISDLHFTCDSCI